MDNIVLLGLPAAGKTTLGNQLEKEYDIPHISMRKIIHETVPKKTPLWDEINSYIRSGEPTPEIITYNLFLEYLESKGCSSFIVDFFLRSEGYINMFDGLVGQHHVLDLNSNRITLMERGMRRLRCNCGEVYNEVFRKPEHRNLCDTCGSGLYKEADDSKELLLKRINLLIEPYHYVKQHYEKASSFVTIDANRSIGDVFQQACEAVK